MRDPEAYARHGRNNPHHPDQMREHPYDFVALPERPKLVTAPGHDAYPAQLYSGILALIYQTVTPLHIGSGSFESAQACGLDIGKGSDQPVRGIVRRAGRPVLPGSSWKGAVRSRYETITQSRLALASDFHKLPVEKVPRALQENSRRERWYQVKIADPRVAALRARRVSHDRDPEENRRQLQRFSPAESLFGAMGYRGRVHPGDGLIESPAPGAPLSIAPMESPAAHRLAKPGEADTQGSTIVIQEVEGRKLYYDGPVVHARRPADGDEQAYTHELIDYVPARSKITLEVHLESVDLAELGALLISAGHGLGAGILRFGGFKPAGLGKVGLSEVRADLRQGAATRSWKRPAPIVLDLEQALQAAHQKLIDADALRELDTITTLERP